MSVSKQTAQYYRQFRVRGLSAEISLRSARILRLFRLPEMEGLVRIEARPEEENYFDVFGEPDSEAERQSIVESLEAHGCWVVVSEYLSPSGSWETGASLGMCSGYPDPLCPFSAYYAIELMEETLQALETCLVKGASVSDVVVALRSAA